MILLLSYLCIMFLSTNYKDFEYKYNTDYLYNASGSLRALFKYLIVGLVIVVVLVYCFV